MMPRLPPPLRVLPLTLAAALAVPGCPGSSSQKSESNVSSPNFTPDEKRDGAGRPALEPRRYPHFASEADPAAFATACRAGLGRAEKRLPGLLAEKGERTVENLLDPFNQLVIDLEESYATASLMRSVHPSREIRQAAEKCEQEVARFRTELGLNRELFDAFARVDAGSLDADARRLVEHTLRDFRRAGVDKDDATRGRLRAIDEKLVELGQAFEKNLTEDVRRIVLDSEKDLAGLPGDYIAARLPAEKGGKIHITTDYPDYVPFMTYADSTRHRRELYVANRTRGGRQNEEILREVLLLRKEKASILGYASWADYVTEDKMMKSAANAAEFIERVVKTAKKRAERDYGELLAWKRANQDKRARRVEDYEKSYIENKVKAQSYSFDSQEVRPYFPYDKVLAGLLDITARKYDISYEPVESAVLWHEDVRAYDVVRGGVRIGRIYLDMHPREGKYKHAAQFTLLSGADGKQLPEGVLVCNFPNPRTDPPALMEHDEVVTTFHEFGHLMHHIFGGQGQRWVSQSGVATEWDFVEAPSQMFEEWASRHETLATFARHHETGEPIPEDLVERMRRAEKFGIGVATLQQMFYASISLGFHTADPKELDMQAELERLQARYTPFPYVEGTHFHTSFGHLLGYSAIYYTYMWSLVIAKDLFSPFDEHGLMNTEWTYRYRDQILAPGGRKDAADLVAEFLGRPFSYEAFERYLEGR